MALFLKNKTMEDLIKDIEAEKAAIIQIKDKEFNCQLMGVGLLGKNMVRIVLRGLPEDIQKLLEYVEKPKDENTEAPTV